MNRRRMRDAALAILLGFGVGSAAIAANDARGHHGRLLGNVDFFEFCRIRYGDEVRADAANVSSDAIGWRRTVRDPVYGSFEINVNEACSLLYQTPAVARVVDDDFGDPYSWRCYST